MLPNPMEGSWEEVQAHAAELKGHRVKLIITDQEQPKTLADFLGSYIGAVNGSGENISENCGEKFTDYLIEKHKQGHL